MNVLSRLNIGARLGTAFGVVLVLTLIVGLFSVNRLGVVNDATADIATNWLVATKELGAYDSSITAIRRAEALLAMTAKVEAHDKMEEDIRSRQAKSEQVFKRYEATVTTDEEREIVKAVIAARSRYFDALGKTFAASRSAGAKRDEVIAVTHHGVRAAASGERRRSGERTQLTALQDRRHLDAGQRRARRRARAGS